MGLMRVLASDNVNQNAVSASAPLPVAGTAAHDAVALGAGVRVSARARTSNVVAVASDDAADAICTTVGARIVRSWSIPELDWQYAAAAGGIITTTDVVAKASAGAGIRNYVTSLQLRNASATATEFVIKDGATVIWRTSLPASMTGSMEVSFATPLRGSAATAVNIACLTTAAAVFANLQGYAAP